MPAKPIYWDQICEKADIGEKLKTKNESYNKIQKLNKDIKDCKYNYL